MIGNFFYKLLIEDIDLTQIIGSSLASISVIEEDGKTPMLAMTVVTGFAKPELERMTEGTRFKLIAGYDTSAALLDYYKKVRPFNLDVSRTLFSGVFGSPTIKLSDNSTISYVFKAFSKEIDLCLDEKSKRWEEITREQILDEIVSRYSFINGVEANFASKGEKLTGTQYELQAFETDLAFIKRLAVKWNTEFKFVYDSDKDKYILRMTDVPSTIIKPKEFSPLTTTYPLYWGDGLKNLKSFNFKPKQNASSGGDIDIPEKKDGKLVVTRTTKDVNENIITWELDTQKIKADMKSGLIPQKDFIKVISYLSEVRWEEAKEYYIKKKVVPKRKATDKGQGGGKVGDLGYKASFECAFPDPYITTKMNVEILGKAVPARLKGIWRVSKVVHNITGRYSVTGELLK